MNRLSEPLNATLTAIKRDYSTEIKRGRFLGVEPVVRPLTRTQSSIICRYGDGQNELILYTIVFYVSTFKFVPGFIFVYSRPRNFSHFLCPVDAQLVIALKLYLVGL